MNRLLFTFTAILVFLTASGNAMKGAGNKDSLIFCKIISGLAPYKNAPASERMTKAALMLLGTPYVAGTLEHVPEKLVINLHETDCIIFVETCLALAITAGDESPSFGKFKDIIRQLRYRNGIIDGYASRLHYTSEWIIQGEKNGILKEISRETANTPSGQKFFFMSTHPQSYKQLSGNREETEKIRQIERKLNGYEYFYIPKEKINLYLDKIKPGDIIGFNTSVPGLDITHVGIAYMENGKLTFIHASTTGKRVIIEPAGLTGYLNKIKSNNGIRIIRLI